jgi:hypothetical protein
MNKGEYMNNEAFKLEAKLPVANYEYLLDKLEKVNRKAVKLGLPPIEIIEGEVETAWKIKKEYIEENRGALFKTPWATLFPRDKHPEYWEEYQLFNIELRGEVPYIEGYKFVGVVDKSTGITMVHGDFPEEFRDTTSTEWCDHCHAKRTRNKIIVIQNIESGEYLRIGSTCVADFLPRKYAEDILAGAKWFRELEATLKDYTDEYLDFGKASHFTGIDAFLARIAAIIRQEGRFVSMSMANEYNLYATIRAYWDSFELSEKLRYDVTVIDEDHKYAEELVKFFTNLDESEYKGNQYLSNLVEIFSRPFVHYRHQGILASAFSAKTRLVDGYEAKAKAEKKAKTSDYVGEIGKREDFVLTLKKIFIFENNAHYYADDIRFQIFEDENGNSIVWKGTAVMEDPETKRNIVEGDTVKLKATVKSHEIYHPKGGVETKTTYIQRGKVLELVKAYNEA